MGFGWDLQGNCTGIVKSKQINIKSIRRIAYMANSKLFLTDNNYQSYQSSTNKKIKLKIIGLRLVRLVIIVSSASEMRLFYE
jgi:hypothetical protein